MKPRIRGAEFSLAERVLGAGYMLCHGAVTGPEIAMLMQELRFGK